MGRITTKEILTEMRDTYGQLDPNVYSDALLMRYINAAYITDVCSNYELPELDSPSSQGTTALQPYIELHATPILRVNNVFRVEDSYVMEPINRLDRTRLGGLYTTQTGPPEKWWLHWVPSSSAPGLGIWPTPDKVYALSMDVRRRPTELAIGDQTTLLEIWDDVIKLFAMSRLATRLRLPDEAKGHFQLAAMMASQAGGTELYGSKMYRSVSGAGHYGTRGEGET